MPLIFKNDIKYILRSITWVLVLLVITILKAKSNTDLTFLVFYVIIILVACFNVFNIIYFPFAKIDGEALILYKYFFWTKTIKLKDINYVEIEGNEIFVKTEYTKFVIETNTLNPEERRRFREYFKSETGFETKVFFEN
ncbi:hypothetical protein [Lacihabitans sp. CCS-44]|uniref:hypothetical protein n=1 Tax=Lacihabitans sp. CCS-44 TaxID=2487331 RepID=UPI0020CB7B34|nr:hypothetical protein [Lacihabitans sp. CCS-44]